MVDTYAGIMVCTQGVRYVLWGSALSGAQSLSEVVIPISEKGSFSRFLGKTGATQDTDFRVFGFRAGPVF